MNSRRVIILTGMSGSGKSSAARALEDEGFFVVDNLPPALIRDFLSLYESSGKSPSEVVVVIDVRNRDFLNGIEEALSSLKGIGFVPEIYFFEASDEDLIRRYSETRRRHPLAEERSVPDAIRRERKLLEPLQGQATKVIDSSGLSPHQLRRRVIQIFRGEEGLAPLIVRLQSFGFRYGLPSESDLVMDVRFLPNPHFVENLRPLTGKDEPVRTYVLTQPACCNFLQKFKDLLDFLIPHYRKEGKSYLTLSVGCTGGRHRSVSIVEALRSFFADETIVLEVTHRDLSKG